MAYRPNLQRPARVGGGHAEGIYVWCREHERRAFSCPGGTIPWSPAEPSFSYSVERLARFAAGDPVDIPYHGIPKWARDEGLSPGGFWYATVSTDDTIVWRDDVRQWMVDNGVWD